MDADIQAALTELKSDVNRGFDVVNNTFEKLVTRDVFDATVQRLDSEHTALRRDLESHEKTAERDLTDQRAEVKNELEGFKVTTRWAVGLSVTGVGLFCTIMFYVIDAVRSAQ